MLCPGGVIDPEGKGRNDWSATLVGFLDSNSWYNSAQLGQRRWDDPEQFGYFMLLSERCDQFVYSNPTLGPLRQQDGLALNAFSANSWLLYRHSSVSPNDERIQQYGASQVLLVADAHSDYAPIGYPTNWRDVTTGHRQAQGFGCPAREITQVVRLDGAVRDLHSEIDPAIWARFAGPPEIRPADEKTKRSWEPYRYPHASYVKRQWDPSKPFSSLLRIASRLRRV
jgi:hypothetical protein